MILNRFNWYRCIRKGMWRYDTQVKQWHHVEATDRVALDANSNIKLYKCYFVSYDTGKARMRVRATTGRILT